MLLSVYEFLGGSGFCGTPPLWVFLTPSLIMLLLTSISVVLCRWVRGLQQIFLTCRYSWMLRWFSQGGVAFSSQDSRLAFYLTLFSIILHLRSVTWGTSALILTDLDPWTGSSRLWWTLLTPSWRTGWWTWLKDLWRTWFRDSWMTTCQIFHHTSYRILWRKKHSILIRN